MQVIITKYPLIPGADHCFSKLEFLRYSNECNQDMLEWLSKISKFNKILIFNIYDNHDISGIIKFIEVQKNLNKIIWCNNETQKNLNNNDLDFTSGGCMRQALT